MNINDKLQHFREVSMDNASMKKEALLKDFKQGVDFQCETHKKEADCKFELNKKSNIERIKREARRDFSLEQQAIRRELTYKINDLTSQLFNEVDELLAEYFKSEEYEKSLEQDILNAISLADGEDLIIYIDPADKDKKESLEKNTNFKISISDYSFGRGMRAVISSKNILVDNSFDYKKNAIKENYVLNPYI
jgi:vacuolar-type H+-ATPase subunit E/Vma4